MTYCIKIIIREGYSIIELQYCIISTCSPVQFNLYGSSMYVSFVEILICALNCMYYIGVSTVNLKLIIDLLSCMSRPY